MAETIINGSNGNATVSINGLSYKCQMNSWQANATKRYTEQTTFCSGGWVAETPGQKQILGSATGFLTQGSAASDPLVDFGTTAGVAVVLTAETGSFISFTGHIEVSFGIVAAQNSFKTISFRSTGAASTTWVVS